MPLYNFNGGAFGGGGQQQGGSGQQQGVGGYGPPQGLSQGQADWYRSFQSPASLWQNLGEGVPGHYGQTTRWNPTNGAMGHESSDILSGYYGKKNSIKSIDPTTGQSYVNLPYMMELMGKAGGGGGYENYQMTDYAGGNVTPGEGYQGFDYSTIGSGVDPGAVIAAQEYRLQDAMQGDFAQAGGRAGQSGASMSTPYANQLGEAARKASQDRNALTMQYQYDAAQQQAQRDLAQQQQAAQLDFGGWQTGYQGDLNAQMFNSGQGYDAWALQNQFGMMNNQGQNQYNQQNQMNQQSFLANLLGGLL